ncbi:hypothetical protein CLU79DRAFT_719080 [Phycomyces nitens]|nr:hypothetical protein CLU79DRAFT_719080 [Phycomyces nitens]
MSEKDILEHSVAHHSLILFTKSPKYCLKTGRTRFGFEMNLPADLPDSIQCRNLKISYTATAILTTTTGHTTKTTHPIEVIRLPMGDRLWIGDNVTGIDSGKHVTPYCEYHITMDTQLLSRNSTIPLFVHFAPLIQGLQLKHISVKLRQQRNIATLVPSSHYEGYYENTHILVVSLVVSFPALTQDKVIRRVLDTITYQTVIPIHSPRAAEYERTEHKLPLYANHPRSAEEIEVLTQHGLPIESCPPPYEEKA